MKNILSLFTLSLLLFCSNNVHAQRGKMAKRSNRELHTGLSLIHLTNRGPGGFGAAFHLTGVYHFSPHSGITLGVEPMFIDRGRYDLNGFSVRLGYRYTDWPSGVFIHPNIGLFYGSLSHGYGNYTRFLRALEAGVRLPTKRYPVELSVGINDAHNLDDDLYYHWVWGSFKLSVVFPIR